MASTNTDSCASDAPFKIFFKKNPILGEFNYPGIDVTPIVGEFSDADLLGLFTIPEHNLSKELQQFVSPDTSNTLKVYEIVKNAALDILRRGGSVFGKKGSKWIALFEAHIVMADECDDFRLALEEEEDEE